nr:uncharacterized protein LOC129265305 [Lytechinus pictus]
MVLGNELLALLAQQQLMVMVTLFLLDSEGEATGTGGQRQLRLRRIRRQRRVHLLKFCKRMTFTLAMNIDALTQHRNGARLERPGLWWMHASTNFSPQEWKENFRMSRETFSLIVEALRGEIEKMETGLGCHSVEKRVAITIWRLATPNAYRCISQLFGVGKATAWGITHDVCRAIVRTLLPRYVKFPEGEELQRVKRGFAAIGMPQAVGAIDGTHIQIKAPKDCPHDYFNRKGFYSTIMQAVVDHKCRFTDIYIGWPGCVHDARVLVNSSVYRKGENGTLLPQERQLMSGVEVPLFIIGDAAYPLRTWLMKAYPETGRLTPRQVRFNHQLSRVRMVVERAFGLLKARWRSLSRINESKVENMTHLIAACCVLHNICQDSNQDVDMEADIHQEPIVQHPDPGLDAGPTPLQCRDALAQFLDQ